MSQEPQVDGRDFIKEIQNKAQEAIDKCYVGLVQNVEANKLPEEVFVRSFLPYFSGQVSLTDTPENIIGTWIGIAGSPAGKVQIVNNENEVLFEVPPLMKSYPIKALVQDGKPMKEIMANYKVRNANHPAIGEKFLRNELSGKADRIIENKIHQENAEQWNSIFQRYGIENPNGSPAAENSSKEVGDDDFVFD